MDNREMAELKAKREREAAEEWILMDAVERMEALDDSWSRERYLSLPSSVLLSDPGPGSDNVPFF